MGIAQIENLLEPPTPEKQNRTILGNRISRYVLRMYDLRGARRSCPFFVNELAEQPTCNELVLIAFDLERSLELESTSESGLLLLPDLPSVLRGPSAPGCTNAGVRCGLAGVV